MHVAETAELSTFAASEKPPVLSFVRLLCVKGLTNDFFLVNAFFAACPVFFASRAVRFWRSCSYKGLYL